MEMDDRDVGRGRGMRRMRWTMWMMGPRARETRDGVVRYMNSLERN